ncbi:MAG: GNAT family N-acetyltransferase [Roseiflexaceae bacterium]|nr:GNAT family N-acetyltransferase [Roseiflexaceae bacterium]
MSSHRAIAQQIPDLPRWVEARDLLLWEPCDIFGFQEQPLSLVIRDPATEAIFVIGRPTLSVVQAAVQQNVHGGSLIASKEHAAEFAPVLAAWARTRILFHTLPDTERLPTARADQVRFLDPKTLDQRSLPTDLMQELLSAAAHSAIAATFVAQQPVSFCYAGAVTESLWDVAIDTVAEHRRHGYAALCAAHMIRHMQTQGKQAVWQALENNPASWRLAQKLGFTLVDELVLFEPNEQITADS